MLDVEYFLLHITQVVGLRIGLCIETGKIKNMPHIKFQAVAEI